MINTGRRAVAYHDINNLISEGEEILTTLKLENFLQDGGATARRESIEAWLIKAQRKLRDVLIDSTNAVPFEVARLQETVESLAPQPPSASQLRRAFTDFVKRRLNLLNAMIDRAPEY